jgi:hypothetical protein
MPLISFHIQQPWFAIGIKRRAFRLITIVIIEYTLYLSSNDNDSLRTRVMSMDGHHSPEFQSIEHPLRVILRRVPKVKVHPQSWGGLR